jgi:hypothetical protein
MGEMRSAYKFFIEKLEGKRQLGRCRRRWEDIRMNFGEMSWAGVRWIHLAQDMDQ